MGTGLFAENERVVRARTAYNKGIVSSANFAKILIQICLELREENRKEWPLYFWNLFRETEAREFVKALNMLVDKLM